MTPMPVKDETSRSRLMRRGIAFLTGVSITTFGLVSQVSPAPAAPNLQQVVFNPTGASATWSVPSGVQSVLVSMAGGSGGSESNSGLRFANNISGTLTIPTGATQLEINVGGAGAPPGFNGAGGWGKDGNGGNAGSATSGNTQAGGGGGGATDIRLPSAPANQALMVAGGSGGDGGYGGGSGDFGGVGGVGALSPPNGATSGGGQLGFGGQGGVGGAISGLPGGNGGASSISVNGSGGGGGAGWNSGSGGQAGDTNLISGLSVGGGGGGGGQSYVSTTYVAGATESAAAPSRVTINYLTVTVSTIPSLFVGVNASWNYNAGSDTIYSIASGTLPPGLTLDGNSGLVRGVPTQAGSFTFTVAASTFPDGTHAVTTNTTTSVTVGPGGPGKLVATAPSDIGTTTAVGNGTGYAGATTMTSLSCAYWLGSSTTGSPTGFASSVSPATVVPNQTGATTPITCNFTGLSGNTTYTYKLVGLQSSEIVSNPVTFTTSSTPAQVTTQQATSVETTSATGNGTLTATQNVTSIVCRVATSIDGVAGATPITASPASTSGVVTNRSLTCAMSSLTANTVYYYAFFATDAAGTATSPTIESFTTRQSPPVVGEATAGSITASGVVISAPVTPTNEVVTGIFCRYAISPGNVSRGIVVAASPYQLGSAPITRDATCSLGGLQPSTTYVARMEATDRDGTSASPNIVQFTTAASSGGGGSGGSPNPSPAPAPAPSVTPLPSGDSQPTPTPIAPAPPKLRMVLNGLAVVVNPDQVSIVRTRPIVPVSEQESAPRVRIPLNQPASVGIRTLPRNTWLKVSVRALTGGPWKPLPRVKTTARGVALLKPMEVTLARSFVIRITASPAERNYLRLQGLR